MLIILLIAVWKYASIQQNEGCLEKKNRPTVAWSVCTETSPMNVCAKTLLGEFHQNTPRCFVLVSLSETTLGRVSLLKPQPPKVKLPGSLFF